MRFQMCIDKSGTYAATVCSDKNVYVIDANSGECVAVLSGQSDAISAVSFTHDFRSVICSFIWVYYF